MVIALFAALIAPWFINWDDYKANFETEAGRILGQPVRVNGTADASILPSPSLTFTNVEVGETEGRPMMSVKRFSVTIELMPLIQGQIRVISMKLEEPVVRVAVDDEGRVDWTIRGEASRDLNPDNVVLSGVEISNGTLVYDDARSGSSIRLTDVAATVEARSLAGPWRIEGSYATDGVPAQFQISTGRRLDDGSLRVKADVTPGQWPIAIGADGVIAQGEDGPTYTGAYDLTQVLPAAADEERARGDVTGWRSEGSFKLTRDKLVVDKAVLSEGPPDRPSSLAGSMTLTLGSASRFFATVQARQLDLDRSLGEGPKKPIEMATAAEEFVKWLRGIPVPGIAGTVRFNVPAIVVGGAVIQDVSFSASPADNGWYIEGLQARLPGAATFTAEGNLLTGEQVSFGGNVRLAVNQPATFASWWRGKGEAGTGRLLSPFELTSEKATATVDGLRVERMTTRIGDATITGSFSWSNGVSGSPRSLSTDLQADRLDFVQVRALADLLGGRDLRDARSLADTYLIKLAADELTFDDIRMRGVEADAGFADGSLTVNGIKIASIGGASVEVKKGTISDILSRPVGAIRADVTAPTLDGLTNLAGRLIPDSAATDWFRRTAPFLAPVSLSVEVNSQPVDNRTESTIKIYGDLAATKVELLLGLQGSPGAWRNGEIELATSLVTHDAVGLARQVGRVADGVPIEGGARFDLKASGSPIEGLATSVDLKFGGLKATARGAATLPEDGPSGFAGVVELVEQDLAPALRLLHLDIPGVGEVFPVTIAAEVETSGRSGQVSWTNGKLADRTISGGMSLAENADGGLRLEAGSLDIDQVDLGWIASLGLGVAPLPTGVPEEPWPTAPFGEVGLKGLAAEFDIAAERLLVGDTLQVRNGKLRLGLARDRVDFDVKSGDALGGAVGGGFSIRNVGGNASLTGNLSLVGGALDTVVWQRAGRAVGNGTLDLSANFEATGRSPAGMIASLTGGGTLAIHDGEARYLNPKAGVLVIRDSDLGQEFTEHALRDLFGSYIDNGSLTFPEVEAPFAIAAGTVRFQNITVEAAETRASGSAAIDLNTMTVESDWTLTLDSGDDRFGGDIPPQVGIVFRGPLAAPERILDVLQFNSYLNIRQEARLQEILAMEEQTRLENAYFNRVRRKLREDAERAARLAEEARQARIASAANLEALHTAREIAAEKKAEDELIAWWAVAEQAATDKAAAEAAAADAAAAARAARSLARDAAARVAELTAAARKADDDFIAASAAADAAEEARQTAKTDAANAVAAYERAVADAAAASAALETAEVALATATDAHDTAATEADAAAAKSVAADRQAEATAAIAADTRAAADRAARDAAALQKALADLEAELAAARTTLDAATAEATATAQLADLLRRKADEAAARVAGAAPSAADAESAAADAETERANAEGALVLAETALASARNAHEIARSALAEARTTAEADARAAEAASRTATAARADADKAAADSAATTLDGGTVIVTPAPASPDAVGLAAAAQSADSEAAAKAGIADRSRQALDQAEADFRQKAAALTTAETAVTNARAALADAATAAASARTTANEAAQALRAAEMEGSAATTAAGDAAAVAETAASVVAARTTTRDELAARVDAAREAAESAAIAARQAEDEANTATSDAVAARSAAERGAIERDAAAEALVAAAAAIDTASRALTKAQSDANAATAAVAAAETEVASAEAALAALVDEAGAAALAVDNALTAANLALADLRAAEMAATDAQETAAAAEATADDLAAHAAAMPAGWRPGDRAGSRAEAGPPAADITVVEADTMPVLDDEPESAINLVPVAPRLRPTRTTADSAPAVDLSLPTNDQPLVINQP